jgi:hypothetical protein
LHFASFFGSSTFEGASTHLLPLSSTAVALSGFASFVDGLFPVLEFDVDTAAVELGKKVADSAFEAGARDGCS